MAETGQGPPRLSQVAAARRDVYAVLEATDRPAWYADRVLAALDPHVAALRGQWVAEALARACERIVADCSHGDFRMGVWPAPTCPFCQPKANSVAALAAEYEEGTSG